MTRRAPLGLAIGAVLVIAACGSGTTSDEVHAPGTSSSPPASAAPSGESVPFTIIDSTATSYRQTTQPELITVRDAAAWEKLWSQHTAGLSPAPPRPAVDFGTSSVLAYFDGEGLGAVTITDVKKDASGAMTVYVRKQDTTGCTNLAVIEHHAELIRVPVAAGRVAFMRSVSPSTCP